MFISPEVSSDFVILGRHCHSTVNPGGGQPAFNHPEAPLTDIGIVQARILGDQLRTDYGISIADVEVGVSELYRTRETALRAGCPEDNIHSYSEWNEVAFKLGQDMDPEELRMIVNGQLPPPKKVRIAARAAMEAATWEPVIVSSGMVIAGVCMERKMDMSQFRRPVPECGELRRVPDWRCRRIGARTIIDMSRVA
jgi:hypothetical protein